MTTAHILNSAQNACTQAKHFIEKNNIRRHSLALAKIFIAALILTTTATALGTGIVWLWY